MKIIITDDNGVVLDEFKLPLSQPHLRKDFTEADLSHQVRETISMKFELVDED